MIGMRPRPLARGRANERTISSPTGGWNAVDSLEEMPENEAPILTNWVPYPTSCNVRNGYTRYATGLPSQVETVMAYVGPTASKLFAASSSNIYDVTSGGAVGAPVQSGLSNDRWQYVNYSNTGGQYLYIVNGADAARYFDGSTWTVASIASVTSSNLININLHQNRIWFVEKNSLRAWYLATSALQGVAKKFDLTGVVQKGGYLVAMATWTIDAGYGIDDYAVFITSKGEMLMYKGSDPTDPTTWGLIGDFQIGSPIGRRCFMKFAGDLLIVCQDGLYPMSGALQSSRTNPKVALSYKIQYAMSAAISSYGANFGWQVLQFPKENLLWVNVPVSEGASQQQYVMTTLPNKAWCNFSGWEANCWELFNDDPYFGGNGYVGRAWNSLGDNSTNIQADALQAFNYFGTEALKRFTMMRPFLNTNGSPSILGAMNIDFSLADNTALLSFVPTSYATWDSGIWDTSVWGGDLNLSNQWQGCTGVGNTGGVRLKSATQGIQVQWAATTVVWESGGIL